MENMQICFETRIEKLNINSWCKQRIYLDNKMGRVLRYIIMQENEFTANDIAVYFKGEVSKSTIYDALFYLNCVKTVRIEGNLKVYRIEST